MAVTIMIFVLCVLLGTGALVAFGIYSLMARYGPTYRTYQELAERYRGNFQADSLWRDPCLAFQHGDSNCVLETGNRKIGYPGGSTRLTIDGHDPKVTLLVTTSSVARRLRGRTGLKPVGLPPEFANNDFLVQSNQPDQAATLFQSGTWWKLRQLACHVGPAGVEIRIERGKLVITQGESLKSFQALDDFVRFGLELHHHFSLKATPGIEFVEEDLVAILEAVQCPICSESIHDSMVVCVRCKTPHCLDCWEYNGQCATFACGEARCLGSGAIQTVRSG